MKGSKLAFLTLLSGLFLLVVSGRASAQGGTIAPSQQFGMGVFVGGNALGGGLQGAYALSPAIHIGLQLSAAGSSDTGSASSLHTFEALYVRGLLEGTVNPFFQARLGLTQFSTTETVGNQSVSTSSSRTEIAADFGLEYFVNRNVGIFAFINFLDIKLSPSETNYGLGSGAAGVEWWFNR